MCSANFLDPRTNQDGQETARIFPASPASHAGSSFTSPQNLRVNHVVVIIQENRTVDYLFNGLPGADTVAQAKLPNGRDVALQAVALSAPYGISHRHNAFTLEYDHGRLDGFDKVGTHCQIRHGCPLRYLRAYGYAPHQQVKPYFAMAEQYGFADRMFQSNQGPSFPAHLYLFSGTSEISPHSDLLAAENPRTADGRFTGGCDSPRGSLVVLIDPKGRENKSAYPCFDHPALPQAHREEVADLELLRLSSARRHLERSRRDQERPEAARNFEPTI